MIRQTASYNPNKTLKDYASFYIITYILHPITW